MIRVGIDAGGTFTDCVASVGHQLRTCKLRSRPDDPAAVVEEALARLVPAGEPVEIVFSTTAATNALVERKGGPTILVTTAGFEDVLEIGRQARPILYALQPRKLAPLVGEADRLGARERVTVDGAVEEALSEGEIERLAALIGERPQATIAICFLHGHVHPLHEQQLAVRLRARGRSVSISSEVCPLPREYERTSTTVVDAYVAPRLGETLLRLAGPTRRLRVMESSGGARADVTVRPARTVLSGPAAGLVSVERWVKEAGLGLALALDVGGTSTDVARVTSEGARRVDELTIAGLPIALPSLAVHSVGAGGGSIAWIDDGGALRVGPHSAGADPGPAAYSRGGTEPTVTDAHLVLGRLGETLAGGAVSLDLAAARAAIAPLAEKLAISVETAAEAIVAVTSASIARALRAVSEGEDADAIVAYGGAAGLHVVEVARELGIGRVIVPLSPGLACAGGALEAPVIVEALASCHEILERDADASLRTRADALAAGVVVALRAEATAGLTSGEIDLVARVRYDGQGLEAELELPLAKLSRRTFEDAYQRLRGNTLDRPVVVTRLAARGRLRPTPIHPAHGEPPHEIGWPRRGSRSVRIDGATVRVPIYRRERLRPFQVITGPAICEELSATLFLPVGSRVETRPDLSLSVAVGAVE